MSQLEGFDDILRAIQARLAASLTPYIDEHGRHLDISNPNRGDKAMTFEQFRQRLTPKTIMLGPGTNMSLNDYPLFCLVPDNITGHETVFAQVGHPALTDDPEAPVDGVLFRRTYIFRLWGYYMGDQADVEDTQLGAEQLERVTWACIFDDLALANNAKIQADSWEANFSSVVADPKSSRNIAGFYASIRVDTTESLSTPTLSTADTIEVLETRLT